MKKQFFAEVKLPELIRLAKGEEEDYEMFSYKHEDMDSYLKRRFKHEESQLRKRLSQLGYEDTIIYPFRQLSHNLAFVRSCLFQLYDPKSRIKATYL